MPCLDGPGNSVPSFHCACASFRMLSLISLFIFTVYLIFGQVVYAHDAVFTFGKRIAVKQCISSGGGTSLFLALFLRIRWTL